MASEKTAARSPAGGSNGESRRALVIRRLGDALDRRVGMKHTLDGESVLVKPKTARP